jgi:hypothetical protein
MRIYVSGPMTGVEHFNYPLFAKVSAGLRALGHEVLNPAELDDPDAPPGTYSWEWYLKRDLKAMLDYDAVVLLPNWRKSRGARLECSVAEQLNMPTYEVDVNTLELNEMEEFLTV